MSATILRNGKEYVLVRNSVQCRHCQDIVISMGLRDYIMCSCGRVGVDGGLYAGCSVIGHREDMIDLSVWRTKTEPYEYLNQNVDNHQNGSVPQ